MHTTLQSACKERAGNALVILDHVNFKVDVLAQRWRVDEAKVLLGLDVEHASFYPLRLLRHLRLERKRAESAQPAVSNAQLYVRNK